MMRRLATLTLILFLVPLGGALNPEGVANATLSFQAQHLFTFSTQPGSAFESLQANFSWVPRSTETQDVNLAVDNGRHRDGYVSTQQTSPEDFTVDIAGEITSTANEPRITEPTAFPLSADDEEAMEAHAEYLQSTELIKVTPRVRRLTTRIASDRDTLRGVTDAVASWTATNIDYNLSTTNAEASLPSDQVLSQRNGVCDEITNLFIAQMRSIGVPARYVSGLAYTESSLFDSKWGAHGWAEVYFPGEGWVPYDPTYKQFGKVDATHIVFNRGSAGEKYGASYKWRASGVDVSYDRQWDTELTSYDNKTGAAVDIDDVDVAASSVGQGDYNEITTTVSNPTDAYQTVSVHAQPTQRLTYPRGDTVLKTLSPGATATVSLYPRVGSLRQGYQYTLPVNIEAGAAEQTIRFKASPRASSSIQPPDEDPVDATCQATEARYKPGDTVTITCDTVSETQLCIDECTPRTDDPSTQITAPNTSTTVEARLPGLNEDALITVPVDANPEIANASLTATHTDQTVLDLSADVNNAFAIDKARLTVHTGGGQETYKLTPSLTTRKTDDLDLGYTANITATLHTRSGSELSSQPVPVTNNDERSLITRILDALKRLA